MPECDRYWLLTWTTYGTWLPGDWRGFVSPVRSQDGKHVIHNVAGTPFDRDMPVVAEAAKQRMLGPAVFLDHAHAGTVLRQILAHAEFRSHKLQAAAVMTNHCHLVVGVLGDPSPSRLLGDYKSYSSRVLNEEFGRPQSGTWWTQLGSKRKLPTSAVGVAVEYVRNQRKPLALWIAPQWERH